MGSIMAYYTLISGRFIFVYFFIFHPLQALPVLYAPLRDVISALSFSQLIGVLKDFTIVVPESSETILTLACQNEVWGFLWLTLDRLGKAFLYI